MDASMNLPLTEFSNVSEILNSVKSYLDNTGGHGNRRHRIVSKDEISAGSAQYGRGGSIYQGNVNVSLGPGKEENGLQSCLYCKYDDDKDLNPNEKYVKKRIERTGSKHWASNPDYGSCKKETVKSCMGKVGTKGITSWKRLEPPGFAQILKSSFGKIILLTLNEIIKNGGPEESSTVGDNNKKDPWTGDSFYGKIMKKITEKLKDEKLKPPIHNILGFHPPDEYENPFYPMLLEAGEGKVVGWKPEYGHKAESQRRKTIVFAPADIFKQAVDLVWDETEKDDKINNADANKWLKELDGSTSAETEYNKILADWQEESAFEVESCTDPERKRCAKTSMEGECDLVKGAGERASHETGKKAGPRHLPTTHAFHAAKSGEEAAKLCRVVKKVVETGTGGRKRRRKKRTKKRKTKRGKSPKRKRKTKRRTKKRRRRKSRR
tara:strand:+ start:605 stop:1915 length:1311 start_codon:yes stop_codon:yes gene_type:complete